MKKVKITRTTQGLRTLLLDQLEEFLNGNISVEQAKTTARMSGAVMQTVFADLEHKRLSLMKFPGNPEDGSVANLGLNIDLGCESIKKLG